MKSWPALDLVKCACVLGMIVLHCFYWVATTYGRLTVSPAGPLFPWFTRFMFLGFLPLMLPLSAGCVFRVQVAPQADVPRFSSGHLFRTLGNAVFLIGMGYLLNVLAAGWGALGDWNVLQFTGLSLVVIGIILSLAPVAAVGVAGVAVLAVYPWVRTVGDGREVSSLNKILFGDPTGVFGWPFFPWFATLVFGFLLAHAFLGISDRDRFSRLLVALAAGFLLSALALGGWAPALDPESLMGGQMFSPNVAVVLALLGVSCLAFLLAGWLETRVTLSPRGFVNCFSKGILWIYIVHLVVGCRMDEFLRLVRGSNSWIHTFERRGKILAAIAFPLVLVLLSWLVGYLSIRLFQETRIRIQLRKVE